MTEDDDPGAAAAGGADHIAQLRRALDAAAADLNGNAFAKAEQRAKAASAFLRAARELQDWVAALPSAEEDDASASARRAFEARIDRIRRSDGLEPLFEDPE